MKGIILDFNFQKNVGIISGNDGQRYGFNGNEWKGKINPDAGLRVDFDVSGNLATGVYVDVSRDVSESSFSSADFVGLSPYYQEEFRRIRDSRESYKGKWNWSAFLFGFLWALSKGAWLSVLVMVFVSCFTFGVGIVAYWFIYGARGNYIYYNAYVKRRQLAF